MYTNYNLKILAKFPQTKHLYANGDQLKNNFVNFPKKLLLRKSKFPTFLYDNTHTNLTIIH